MRLQPAERQLEKRTRIATPILVTKRSTCVGKNSEVVIHPRDDFKPRQPGSLPVDDTGHGLVAGAVFEPVVLAHYNEHGDVDPPPRRRPVRPLRLLVEGECAPVMSVR